MTPEELVPHQSCASSHCVRSQQCDQQTSAFLSCVLKRHVLVSYSCRSSCPSADRHQTCCRAGSGSSASPPAATVLPSTLHVLFGSFCCPLGFFSDVSERLRHSEVISRGSSQLIHTVSVDISYFQETFHVLDQV